MRSREQLQELAAEYEHRYVVLGHSGHRIARDCGEHVTTVYQLLRSRGVHLRRPGSRGRADRDTLIRDILHRYQDLGQGHPADLRRDRDVLCQRAVLAAAGRR